MFSQLKQRAALLAQTLTPDGGGGFTGSWQTVGQAWVHILPVGASDKSAADTLTVRVHHRITLRARSDIVCGMRLVTADRRFVIRAVLARDAGTPLITLLCEELP